MSFELEFKFCLPYRQLTALDPLYSDFYNFARDSLVGDQQAVLRKLLYHNRI